MAVPTPSKRDSMLELAVIDSGDSNRLEGNDDDDANDRLLLVPKELDDDAASKQLSDGHAATSNSWFQHLLTELELQSATAFPALLSLVMSKIPWFVSLRFLGNIGGEELAAASLATTLQNVTGMSLSVGLSFALSTLAGQAKGDLMSRGHKLRKRLSDSTDDTETSIFDAEDCDSTEPVDSTHKHVVVSLDPFQDCNAPPITPIVYLLRGMCIQLSLVIPVGIWWLVGIEDTLISLGQGPQLASMASSYIRILVPSLWAYSIQWTLTCFLQTVGMADVPAKATLVGLILHVPFNWLFIYGLDFGYYGVGLATAAFQAVQLTFLCTYILFYPAGQQRLLDATGGTAVGRTYLTFGKEFALALGSCRGFIQYFGLALPGIVIISEWWASETAIFLSGRLTPNPYETLAGMTIYQSINTFCFMFPMAFAISGTSRVGSLLGEGLEQAASWAGKVSVGAAAVLSCILGCLLYLIPHDFLPSLFAPNELGVIHEAAQTIPLLALYVIADGIQVALNGVIKGCGRQCVTVPIVIVAYWIIGVPLAYFLAFTRNNGLSSCEDTTITFCGDVGLVTAMTTGTWIHMLLLAVAVFGTTDWKLEARKAKERVDGIEK
ncbi:multidrug efflux protein [Nitzschia inconspicua]|uniref:Multidrug efflux protein n=1 Tax=Nitzschia inconspicua TaxID=303405 RepID=A0A9K3LVF3_9STRA|nr:multidrug efflux protein [Nitzschia inconspicua]